MEIMLVFMDTARVIHYVFRYYTDTLPDEAEIFTYFFTTYPWFGEQNWCVYVVNHIMG